MNLLGKAMDKGFWEEVRTKECFTAYRKHMQDIWDKECEGQDILALKYRDFKIYFVNGDRAPYSKYYYLHRRQLMASAMLSLIYPDEPKYLDFLMDIVYAICDEYTWCLNAHQPNLETNNNCHIDLFASETAFSLAETYHILGDRLDPLIKNRIIAEIDRRVTYPYKANKYGWEKATHNWNAVCTGSIGCTFMLMHPEMMDEMKPRFDENLERYLSGFKDDGICLEGCHYWHYGFGYFTVYADMIRTFTNGETDYFKRDKVRTVATFIQKAFISKNAIISFSDGSRAHRYHMGLVHYLKKEFPNDVVVYAPEYSYVNSGCARFCAGIRAATWLSEEYFNNPTPDDTPAEYYAADSEMLIKRTRSFGFAAKGAYNNEPHNHNDVGSFIFAKNGRQVLIDHGSGPYSKQYFNKDTRYGYIECSSKGHNLPIINGEYQKFGTNFAAKDTKFENGVFTTDIAGAYGIEELKSLVRSFSFTDDEMVMKDIYVYEGEGVLTERLVSLIAPAIEENGKIVIEDTVVTYDPEVCTVEISEDVTASKVPIFFMDFKLNPGIKEFTCTVK